MGQNNHIKLLVMNFKTLVISRRTVQCKEMSVFKNQYQIQIKYYSKNLLKSLVMEGQLLVQESLRLY